MRHRQTEPKGHLRPNSGIRFGGGNDGDLDLVSARSKCLADHALQRTVGLGRPLSPMKFRFQAGVLGSVTVSPVSSNASPMG
jgi:hypothetical protein